MHHTLPYTLAKAYCATEFRVFHRQQCLRFYAGRPHNGLGQLLGELNTPYAALITAYSPYSQTLLPAQNAHAQAKLYGALEGRWRYLDAEGADPTGQWPAEPSLLVLSIPLWRAQLLGRTFGQHALVWLQRGNAPRLVATESANQPLLDAAQRASR